MRLAKFFLVVPLLPPQARRSFVLSSIENPSMVDQQISYFDLQHCAAAVASGLDKRLHSCSLSASQIIAIIVKLSGLMRGVYTRASQYPAVTASAL